MHIICLYILVLRYIIVKLLKTRATFFLVTLSYATNAGVTIAFCCTVIMTLSIIE